MSMLNLKDVAQAMEVARRCRADLPDGAMRDAMDTQVFQLVRCVTKMIEEDDRLVAKQRAEQALQDAAPSPIAWTTARTFGRLRNMVRRVMCGEDPATVWQRATSNGDLPPATNPGTNPDTKPEPDHEQPRPDNIDDAIDDDVEPQMRDVDEIDLDAELGPRIDPPNIPLADAPPEEAVQAARDAVALTLRTIGGPNAQEHMRQLLEVLQKRKRRRNAHKEDATPLPERAQSDKSIPDTNPDATPESCGIATPQPTTKRTPPPPHRTTG